MPEFEDLQQLWQSQSAPVELDAATREGIDRFHRRTRISKRVLYITMPATVAYLGLMIYLYGSFWYTLGIVVTMAAIGFFLFAFQKYQRLLRPIHQPKDTRAFALAHLDQLEASDRFARRTFPPYALILLIGLSLSIVGFIEDRTLGERILFHAVYAGGLSAFFYGIWCVTQRRWKRKFGGLKGRLEAVLAEEEGK